MQKLEPKQLPYVYLKDMISEPEHKEQEQKAFWLFLNIFNIPMENITINQEPIIPYDIYEKYLLFAGGIEQMNLIIK